MRKGNNPKGPAGMQGKMGTRPNTSWRPKTLPPPYSIGGVGLIAPQRFIGTMVEPTGTYEGTGGVGSFHLPYEAEAIYIQPDPASIAANLWPYGAASPYMALAINMDGGPACLTLSPAYLGGRLVTADTLYQGGVWLSKDALKVVEVYNANRVKYRYWLLKLSDLAPKKGLFGYGVLPLTAKP